MIGLIYMKPDHEILPHHCPQSLPNASKDEGIQFAGGGSWMLEVHNSDFTVLETVGCDGHHISPTRQQLERESRVAGEAMKAPPITFTQLESGNRKQLAVTTITIGPTLAQGPT